MKPKVFIGSSSEKLDVAYAIQQNLQNDGRVIVWNQGIFNPGNFILEDLIETLTQIDFGIFVFSPDDISLIRDKEQQAVRDNVVFELGLFIGRLGKKRTFFIMPEINSEDFRLPSDLLGLYPLKYDSTWDLRPALGPACNEIRSAMKKLGIRGESKIDMIQTQKDVYAYVFNHLNPFKDISLTHDFLKNLPANKWFTKIDDVLYPLDSLVHHYVPHFIEPWMRIYFAYKLKEPVEASDAPIAYYKIGIAYSKNDSKWVEGLPIGIPSNVHRVYTRKGPSRVRNAHRQINTSDVQNQEVKDEGSVIALPILYSDDDSSKNECIGVIGISSPNVDEVTRPDFESVVHELSTIFSALFYAYGRYLQKSVKSFEDVVEQIRCDIAEHYESIPLPETS